MAVLNASTDRWADRSLKMLFRTWLVMLALLFAGGLNLPAQTPREYEVKAAFLYNFVQFVEWPADAFSDAQSPVVIGILGDDPFGASLDDIVRDEKVNNRPLVIRHYQRVEDIKDCQILFISQSENRRLEEILAGLKDRSILTVGDTDGFARRGGMIRFVTENNKIRFRINVKAAKTANLTISSKLLRLAEIVEPGKD
jgi:hypothetical protein